MLQRKGSSEHSVPADPVHAELPPSHDVSSEAADGFSVGAA
jgi:hypothetical protein